MEIQKLKSESDTHQASKKSLTSQIVSVSPFLHTLPTSADPSYVCQQQANSRIREINSKLESSDISVADITFKESALDNEKKRKLDLEAKLRAGDYVNQQSKLSRELRDLEDQREGLHTQLTSLNTQADVRAKLGLKKAEAKSKEQAIQSL